MSAGAVAGGVVGGVIGFFVGGPAGAAIGFSIGMSVGGMLDPVKGPSQPGPQINDKNFQTAKYGEMLSRFYGTIAVFGNVTWIEGGKLKVVFRKKKSGGKGGSAKAAPVAYYSATFFLSLGLGPIAGIRRIWCSDKLIYNAGSDDLETIIASNQAATGFRVYLGTDDQLPDPRYEADVGVGNASAYRGEAYIAFYDFQLADFGNTLQGAQFKVEVVTADAFEVNAVVGDAVAFAAWRDVAEGNNVWCAVATSQSYVALSYDAQNWTRFSVGAAHPWRCIAYGANGFCMLSENGKYAVSSDGRSWTVGDLPVSAVFPRIIWNGSRFCAVSYQDDIAITSENGTLWTVHALPAVRDWQSLAWGGGLFVAVASGTDKYATSPDGETWTERTLPAISDYSGIAHNGERFCLVSRIGTVFRLSEDGLSWASVTAPGGSERSWLDISASLGVFAAIAGSFTNPAMVALSADGFQWDGEDLPDDTWQGIANLGEVAVGVAPGENVMHAFRRMVVGPASLASVIESEIELSSLLTASDVDTSLLTADVRGDRVSGGSIRSALEPLQGAFPFDIIPSGYQLKCVPRGQASTVTIPWEDLGAADGDTPGDLLQESREMDSQLPALVAVKYLDAAREYAVGEQSKARINTQAINRVDREVSLVLTADEAAAMADVLVNLPWLERTPAKFTLPPPYLYLEPADVVTVVTQEATHEFRLTDINYTPDGRLECDAKPNRATLYTSTAKGGEGVPPTGTIPLAGPTLLVLLDIPVVDETLQNSPGFGAVAVGYTGGWPGAVAFRSIDAGQTWTELQGFTGLPTVGYARGTLPASSGAVIDQRSVVVDMLAGELESVTRDQMLAGVNYAAYGADGRWEIVRFQNAVLQADGSYLLSGFVRGDRGTEWATGLHQAGDLFVLLDDPDSLFIDMAVGSIGVPATYRGVTSGATIDSASDVPFTYQGVNLECLSPVSANGVRGASGNFSATFVRRSRLSSSWWTTGVPAPIGETTEAYDIEVMDGSTVARTLTATSPEFDYPVADQVADFGSAQAAITFRIYQRSDVVGRGYPLEVTL